ncbi:FtsX-like permease family protein [Clostridium sp.]|uniref:FtsX-like permease family protein n=1 Tax=Clostridium sp. TaxID=1506 RepID=UPI0026361753|nr:FtsX-like permease family protein [Clostridium sp.]
MRNKAHNKSIGREILSSKARFISILAIIFLGVSFYTGIKSSGPDMEATINNFYSNYNLMDSKIVSELGLNDNDLELLKKDENILDYYGTRSLDVNLTNINNVVKFMEYNPKSNSNINKLIIVDGRLPKDSGEIVIDEKVLKDNNKLNIGDDYIIESDKDTMESFNKKTYKIVGFAKSPMYIDKESRGNTTVGTGNIDYFAVINSSDISMDLYTEVYVRFENVKDLDAYSDEYKDKMEENNKGLKDLFSNRQVKRIEEVKLEPKDKINKAYKEIEDGEKELLKAEQEIKDGKVELQKGINQYEQGILEYEKEIKDGELQLVEGEKQITQGKIELDKQKVQFEEGQNKINEAKKDLDKAKEQFLNQGINPDNDTSEYKNQIEGLNNLITTYNSLSKDIVDTVNNIEEGSNIQNEKIQYWKAVISNPNLGLEEVKDLINQLENEPSNTNLALNIAGAINLASETASGNKIQLQTLVEGITQYQNGLSKYEEEIKIFNEGKEKLKEAQNQLDIAKVDLEKGKNELEIGKIQGKEELDKGEKQLEDSEKIIKDGEKEIKENNEKLLDARKELEKQEAKLNDLDNSKYYFFNRDDNPGYSTYGDSIQSLDNIASVFPVFFFLVAVLICLTTMTRMVEENRTEIGTLKALGYSNLEISKKFVIYATLASVLGSFIGILVGSTGIPYIVNNAYGDMFNLPKLEIYYYNSYIVQSMVVSILCTVGAALFVLKSELKDNPSNLMRVKAPKLGKKILLERITPLWKRFNFNQKVTFRNLFRYKQRMIMTILGIAGCMAMLVTGFALNKSNEVMIDKQFNKLMKYDAMVIFNDDLSEEDNENYYKTLTGLDEYESSLNIHQEPITFSKEKMNKQSAMMYIPKDIDKLNDYVSLSNRKTEVEYKLSNNGVIISEKLAKLLKASIGDLVTLKDSDENAYEVKIDNIAENYAAHYIYMSPEYYKDIFKKDITYNAQLLNLKSDQNEEDIQTTIMECDKVVNITMMSKIKSSSNVSSLKLVMLVIIIASGCLAFVVLYNLININVSERIRELSTIKVLGFYDNEVTMYIFRENIILTVVGILAGSFMGKILYNFILNTAETDTMMMIPDVYMSSYIASGVMTLLFAFLVMIMMHIKLKKINMIDALKSVE